jgi:hypothetical protein
VVRWCLLPRQAWFERPAESIVAAFSFSIFRSQPPAISHTVDHRYGVLQLPHSPIFTPFFQLDERSLSRIVENRQSSIGTRPRPQVSHPLCRPSPPGPPPNPLLPAPPIKCSRIHAARNPRAAPCPAILAPPRAPIAPSSPQIPTFTTPTAPSMKPFGFSLKLWLTSVLTGCGMICLVGYLTDDSTMTFFGYESLTSGATLIFSAPCFLLFWATTTWLTKKPLPIRTKRWTTTAIGVLLTAAPFGIIIVLPFILFGDLHHTNWRFLCELATCYAAPIVAGTWLYKFPPRPSKFPTSPTRPL